jgi:hypothetical protein
MACVTEKHQLQISTMLHLFAATATADFVLEKLIRWISRDYFVDRRPRIVISNDVACVGVTPVRNDRIKRLSVERCVRAYCAILRRAIEARPSASRKGNDIF